MAGDGVNWGDYASLANTGGLYSDEFGGGDLLMGEHVVDVNSLNKALSAGSDINNPGAAAGEGFPLRTESLDKTLYNVTYTAKDIKFWKMLFKDPAYNTIEEYNRAESYGSGEAAFTGEGELPNEDDSTYSRQYTKIKFMGTTRRVTHVMTTIRAAHGDAVGRETTNGTLWLLRQLERALFQADERYVSIQFDGLEKLLISAYGSTEEDDGQLSGYSTLGSNINVIDMRGAPLSEDHVTDMAERLQAEPNYGAPSDLWSDTGVLRDLSKIMYPKERVALPAPKDGMAGFAVNGIRTPFGDIEFNPDIFLPMSKIPTVAGIGKSGQRPNAPTVAAPTSPAYAGSASAPGFAAGDAGVYYYKVVAGSRYGSSPPTTSAAVTVAAGDEVQIAITDSGPDTSYYEVFRSDKGGAATTCRSIMRVRRTAASQTIHDINRFLPNTSKAYMLTQTAEVLKWKQLAPFTKIPLATIEASVRWMQMLYGALQVMKPLQNGMFINVGKLATGVNG